VSSSPHAVRRKLARLQRSKSHMRSPQRWTKRRLREWLRGATTAVALARAKQKSTEASR
jgi:hypothetical protein